MFSIRSYEYYGNFRVDIESVKTYFLIQMRNQIGDLIQKNLLPKQTLFNDLDYEFIYENGYVIGIDFCYNGRLKSSLKYFL